MNRFFFHVIFFFMAIFLSCCSSGSGSNGTTNSEMYNGNSSLYSEPVKVRMEGCKENGISILAKETAEDNDEKIDTNIFEEHRHAEMFCDTLYDDKPMFCTLAIPDVDDYCSVTATINYEYSGDTLSISYGDDMIVSKCICTSTHYFDVATEYREANYVNFKGQVYEIFGSSLP